MENKTQEVDSICPTFHLGIVHMHYEDDGGLLSENQKNRIRSDRSTSNDENGNHYYV